MFIKNTKNLIVFGVIAFSFLFTNFAFADYPVYAFSRNNFDIREAEDMGYERQYYTESYRENETGRYVTEDKPVIVYNYYYGTNEAPKASSSSTTTNTTTNNTKEVVSNTSNTKVASSTPSAQVKSANVRNTASNGSVSGNLGASAYGSVGASRSTGFMPNTFGGWFLVILLILAIVVLYRMIVRKTRENKA